MSHALRSTQNSKVMYVIMGLLMLGLTGFGIGGFTGGNVKSIGTVGQEEIPVATYARAYQNAVNQMSNRIGRNLTPNEIEQLGIGPSVLESVIAQAALDNEASEKGISVGDEIIREQILKNPNFQGLTGGFDKDTYNFYLERQLRLTPKEFDDLLRKENARAIIQAAVNSGVAASDDIPVALIGYAQETRDFEWAWLTELNLDRPVGKPTQAALEKFYNENKDKYQSLKTYNVTYAWLSPEMLNDKVAVDEADLHDSYDLQSDRFNKPEQRAVERLVFGSEADAKDARERLDAGLVTFDQLVQERGLEPGDVDMGDVSVKDLSQEAAKAVFATQDLGIVGPVKTALGPALFRVNAVMAEDITPFEDVRDELRAELAGEAARRMVSDLVTDIDDLLAGGATIEDLGKETDMQTGTIDFNADSTGGLNGYQEFREKVLDTKPGDFPELVDLPDGGIFALRVNKIAEPALIPLAEIKDRVIADWQQDRTLAKLEKIAAELEPKLSQGADFAALGLAPNKEMGATRAGFFEGLPPETTTELFKLEKGQVKTIRTPNGLLVLRLSDIHAFDPQTPENKAAIARLTDALSAQIGTDILELYTAALRTRAGVNLSQPAINSINAQIATR